MVSSASAPGPADDHATAFLGRTLAGRTSRIGSRVASRLVPYGLVLLVVVLLGTFRLPTPFHGDQALFLLGAQVLNAGGVYYVDFWDLKQPGMFFFFWLAGRTFGFSEVGVHAFELFWLTALAVVLSTSRDLILGTSGFPR